MAEGFGGEAFVVGEEAAEAGLVGEAEAVGDVGDGEVGAFQEPRCFHQEHLADIVADGAPRHLPDDAREVGRRDAEFRRIKSEVAVFDEVPGQQAHKGNVDIDRSAAEMRGADGAFLHVAEVEQEEGEEHLRGFGAEAMLRILIINNFAHPASDTFTAVVGDVHNGLSQFRHRQVGRTDNIAHRWHFERLFFVSHKADAAVVVRAAINPHLETRRIDIQIARRERQFPVVVEEREPPLLHQREGVGRQRVLHLVGEKSLMDVGRFANNFEVDVVIVQTEHIVIKISYSVHNKPFTFAFRFAKIRKKNIQCPFRSNLCSFLLVHISKTVCNFAKRKKSDIIYNRLITN